MLGFLHLPSLSGRELCHTITVAHLCTLIQRCPWDPALRELRVEAYKAVGEVMNAIADLRVATKLTQDNTMGIQQLASLYYQIGDVEQALRWAQTTHNFFNPFQLYISASWPSWLI